MTELSPKTVVARYVQAVQDGDLATIRDSFAEDATWEYPGDLPLSKVWTGRAAIVGEFLGGMGTLLAPGCSPAVRLTNILADGDTVLAEWTSHATAKSGASYDNRNAGIFTVHNGKITSVREYTDTRHVAQVLFPEL
jgi:uncharacterized protein